MTVSQPVSLVNAWRAFHQGNRVKAHGWVSSPPRSGGLSEATGHEVTEGAAAATLSAKAHKRHRPLLQGGYADAIAQVEARGRAGDEGLRR